MQLTFQPELPTRPASTPNPVSHRHTGRARTADPGRGASSAAWRPGTMIALPADMRRSRGTPSSLPSILALGTAAALLYGCRQQADSAQPEQAVPAPSNIEASTGTRSGNSSTHGSKAPAEARVRYTSVELFIEESLAAACGNPRPRLLFAFDSDAVREDAEAKLDGLAACLLRHPLEEESLEIIGHADPRGTEEYNRELGLSRADAVAGLLARYGVDPDRIDTYSRGEYFASRQPEDWPQDRKVVIRLDR